MCVILTAEPGADVDNDTIEAMWRSNRDGAGVAWWDGTRGRVRICKPIWTADALITAWRGIPTDTHRMLHCRITTSGANDKRNTHPHRLTPTIALAHNGVIHGLGTDDRSDTVHLVEMLRWWRDGWTRDTDAMRTLAQWTRGSRLAILDGPRIVHTGHWEDLGDGVCVSNTYWQWAPLTLAREDEDWDTVRSVRRHCPDCGDRVTADTVCRCGYYWDTDREGWRWEGV